MSRDRDADKERDRFARSLPGWLLRKTVHGVGWIVGGAGYLVFVGTLVGLCWAIGGWFGDSSLFDWFERQNALLELVLALALSAGLFWGCFMVALLPGSLVASIGAFVADPDADRSFGPLAGRPHVGRFDNVDTGPRWFISRSSRLHLKREAEAKHAERMARIRERSEPLLS